jgi:hypothetical protein
MQNTGKRVACVGLFIAGNLFRRALGNDATTALAALGTKIDDPIRLLNHVQVVFDDQNSVAEIDQTLQDVEKFEHIVKMKAGRRLIEDVHRAARLALGKFTREFDALRFSSRKRRRGLS